jgi:hypothetical protein
MMFACAERNISADNWQSGKEGGEGGGGRGGGGKEIGRGWGRKERGGCILPLYMELEGEHCQNLAEGIHSVHTVRNLVHHTLLSVSCQVSAIFGTCSVVGLNGTLV